MDRLVNLPAFHKKTLGELPLNKADKTLGESRAQKKMMNER